MPIYKRKVTFTREFTIQADNAKDATAKLEEEVDRVEWDADVRSEGVYPFEDEDVTCPHCHGDGVVEFEVGTEEGTDTTLCHTCDGNGSIPLETATALKQNNEVCNRGSENERD